MAFQDKGILGGFRGKIGPLVGRIYNGINVISSRPRFKSRTMPLAFFKNVLDYDTFYSNIQETEGYAIALTGVSPNAFVYATVRAWQAPLKFVGHIYSFGATAYYGLCANNNSNALGAIVLGVYPFLNAGINRVNIVVNGVSIVNLTSYAIGVEYEINLNQDGYYSIIIDGIILKTGYIYNSFPLYLTFRLPFVGAYVTNNILYSENVR